MKLWSPEQPFLYDVIIKNNDDEIKTYFAMRKLSVKDNKLLLNNKPYFIHGLLDQGYFSDGIYTPVSYQAYKDDILTMKELGFNDVEGIFERNVDSFLYFSKYSQLLFSKRPCLCLRHLCQIIQHYCKNSQVFSSFHT